MFTATILLSSVAAAAVPWFQWWARQPEFKYSDYDDSLSFAIADEGSAQLELVWVDLSRYAGKFEAAELADWLGERLASLRAKSSSPILLAALSGEDAVQERLRQTVGGVPGVRLGDLRPIAAKLGSRFFDERAAPFSGTRLGDRACVLAARELACRWAPALLCPRLKAVAVDLDRTLYEGVLGEEGTEVKLTPAHADLQRYLLELREEGVFLALISRNEEADVKRLFEARGDFPLRWDHFSATAISWGSKAEAVKQVARQLNIGLDAVLYVDDNPGELAAVASDLPMIATGHAMADASRTRCMLEYYPGLWAWERTAADTLRVTDVASERERRRLAAAAPDPREYLCSLQVKIRIETTPKQRLGRLHELSQKTNQFNLNLERFSEVELARLLESPDHRVAVIGLSDRLSDSGWIGLIVARREGDTLAIRELAVSCRALGRRLEDVMIFGAVRGILRQLPASRIEFLHRTGPRNAPAREWLARIAGEGLAPEGRVSAQDALTRFCPGDYPVEIIFAQNEPK